MTLLPKVKLKALVSFPATVLDGTGIDIARTNGTYQFNLDFGDFAPPTVISNLSNLNALLWNSSTGAYTLATAASLTGTGGGAPAGGSNPLMDSVAAPGVATPYSREDHVHPSDTSRATVTYVDAQDALKAPLDSPVFINNPRAPTPAAADNDTSIATTAFLTNASVRNDLVQSMSTAQKAQVNSNSYIPATTQTFLSGSGTYTTPANCLRIRVRGKAGGGGGSGSGTTPGNGGTGGNTTFSTCTANGGGAGLGTGAGGAGGTATGGSIVNLTGGAGGSGSGLTNQWGGYGGGGQRGIAGQPNQSAGGAAAANSGCGGGGGGCGATINSGGGGGEGGLFEHFINSPVASYSYAVGVAGTAGTAGTSGVAGGAGGSGVLVVEEFYG